MVHYAEEVQKYIDEFNEKNKIFIKECVYRYLNTNSYKFIEDAQCGATYSLITPSKLLYDEYRPIVNYAYFFNRYVDDIRDAFQEYGYNIKTRGDSIVVEWNYRRPKTEPAAEGSQEPPNPNKNPFRKFWGKFLTFLKKSVIIE